MSNESAPSGISLRDQIAAIAMHALMPQKTNMVTLPASLDSRIAETATEAYKYADAMLKARGIMTASRYGKKNSAS